MKKAWAAREVLHRADDPAGGGGLALSDAVAAGLERRLTDFAQALSAFQWPAGQTPWFQARLVTGPEEARGYASGLALPGSQATPELKAFSGGFQAWQGTSLAPGKYSFNLSLGGKTESLSLDVAKGDTWGGVLAGVAAAVNRAGLPVRADVAWQNAAFQLGPDVAGAGSVLTFSINPARKDQDLTLADTSGHLLAKLGVRAALPAVGPAGQGNYSFQGLQSAAPTVFGSNPVDPGAATTLAVGRHDLAFAVGDAPQPSSYISKAFDPTQATTLAAGTYSFTSSYGGEARSHSVKVLAGWTWNDVLQAARAEINGTSAVLNLAAPAVAGSAGFSQPGVSASVEPWPIPSATSATAAATSGASITVTGAAGQDFSLADGSGGLLSALGLSTKLSGTPVSFNVHAGDTWRDAYQSMAVALGGAQDSFTAAIRETSIPSTVTPGRALTHLGITLEFTQQNQRIGERINLSDGRTGALASTGLLSQSPGADGLAIINGTLHRSENNLFSQDQGRVLLGLEHQNAKALPLAVTAAVDGVEKGWSRITEAWNSLAKYLNSNADALEPTIGARLEAPLKAQAASLRWLGVSNAGRKGQLWTNADTFWRSLTADKDRAEAALWQGPDGLVPAWRKAVEDVRGAGAASWLKPATGFDAHRPSLTSEFQLEQKHRLLKLLG